MARPNIQKATLVGTAAATETATFNILLDGNTVPDNIYYVHQCDADMDGTELVDITGKMLGCDTAVTANVHAQLTLSASEVIRLNLSTEARGFWQLTVTAVELDADQSMDVWIITW